MKKWIKNVIIILFSLAIICVVFWKIEWISSWKEVVALYGILVIVITVNTLSKYLRMKIRNCIDGKEIRRKNIKGI